MSQEELQIAAFESQQEILEQALDQRLLTQQEYANLMEQSQQSHVEAMNAIDQARVSAALNGFQSMFGDLASLMNTENRRLFQIGKAAAIAEAVVSGYRAAVEAWEKGMAIGGPPLAAAFTAASLAKTGALISNISSQSFGGSGSQTNSGGGGGSSVPRNVEPIQNTQASRQRPQRVIIEGIDEDSVFTGRQLQRIFDQLYEENADRGFIFEVAQ